MMLEKTILTKIALLTVKTITPTTILPPRGQRGNRNLMMNGVPVGGGKRRGGKEVL